MKTKFAVVAALFISATNLAFSQGARPNELGASPLALGAPGISWYGRLDTALAEAKRSNRPIMFMSTASQCNGVPGVF